MGLMDNMDDKAKDIMSDPEKRQEVEQIAKDKGIPVEQAAKQHLGNQTESE